MPLNPRLIELRCFACERRHPKGELSTVCVDCGMPLEVRYQLERNGMPVSALASRGETMWRYREVLPVDEGSEVSLHEGFSPMLALDGGRETWIKDESRNPTGSFKARGIAAAVSVAKLLGAKVLSAPSAGNAASALAAYGAAAKMKTIVAMPDDTPKIFVDECRHYGAEVHLVPGTISDAGKWLAANRPAGCFDVSTLKEPYRVEGKKTMGYELYEQLNGSLPDVVVYPTGGGTGLIGMWKAWNEMQQLGWIGSERPRLVCVQAAGCAPVVKAFESGAEKTEPWPDADTRAWGLRVPAPIGGFVCLRALRATNGTAVAIEEAHIAPAAAELAARTGIDICPEGGAVWAAFRKLRESGWVKAGERTVLFNTGTGLKYR